MKIFKKLSFVTALLFSLSIGASFNIVSANSQTNKLPYYMRNKWYGNESEDGLSSIKLYGNPYVDNGYNDLPITHIRRYGYRYDLHVPNADPIEVWYSHGHLNGLESGTAYIHLYAHTRHYHVNRVAQWYNNHTYRNRVHYARSNHISSHYYQTAFADADDDNSSIAVTNNYHSLIKGINSSDKYKVSKMISATSPFKAKYLKYISGNYNGNDSDVYAIKYHGHKYYYADDLANKGNSDPLQGYDASYYKGSIDSWVKPYDSNAFLMRGQHLHRNVEWTYENPYSYHDDYYKYSNGHWHEESISDDAPGYIQNS